MITYKDYVRIICIVKPIQETMSNIDFIEWLTENSDIEDYKNDFPNYEKFLMYLIMLGEKILVDRDFFNNYIL